MSFPEPPGKTSPRIVTSGAAPARAVAAVRSIRAVRCVRALGTLAAAAGLALAAPPGARAQTGPPFGPLRVHEHNPLYRLFHTPVAQAADPVGRGRFRVDVSASYSNIFEASESDDHFQYFDLERLTNMVTLRVGVMEDVELGGRFGVQTNWGGFLDGFILGFHEFFGFPSGQRPDVANGHFAVVLARKGMEPISVPPGKLQEDLQLFAGWRAVGDADSRLAVSLRGSVKLPTGSTRVGTGNRDVAAEVVGRWSGERTHLHGALGMVTLTPSPSMEAFTADRAATYLIALERRVTPRVSWVAQVLGASRYVGGFGVEALDRVPLNLVLGASGVVGGGWLWQASLAEDVVGGGPSVDFTFDLQLGRVWGS